MVTKNGTSGDDSIVGTDQSDSLSGGAGNDTISGFGGRDTLLGGGGDDVLDAGTGMNDPDDVFGGAGDDTLIGYGENDKLDGGEGNDVFVPLPGTVNGGDLLIKGGTSLTGDAIDFREVISRGFEVNIRTQNPTGNDNGIDSFSGQITVSNPDTGESFNINYENIERFIPCFTPGTLIATAKGEIPVEELREGDRVITRDNGIQEIRWVGRKDLTRAEISAQPELKPVLIRKGALGNGVPERDMVVSPNHRMLSASDETVLYFEEREVLVAAKHLTHLDGIDPVAPQSVSYVHFMFDRHEVVVSDGTWSESFQPGDYSLKSIGAAQRAEILTLFPDLKTVAGAQEYRAARRSLKKHEAALLHG